MGKSWPSRSVWRGTSSIPVRARPAGPPAGLNPTGGGRTVDVLPGQILGRGRQSSCIGRHYLERGGRGGRSEHMIRGCAGDADQATVNGCDENRRLQRLFEDSYATRSERRTRERTREVAKQEQRRSPAGVRTPCRVVRVSECLLSLRGPTRRGVAVAAVRGTDTAYGNDDTAKRRDRRRLADT